MTGVGVPQVGALGVEDGVEAGDEHVLRDVGGQGVIDPSQYIPWRGGSQGLGDGTEHAAGASHHQRRRHALARSVPHYQPQPAVFELEKVIEISSHLPSRLVVSGYLPAVELWGRLGKELPLDPACDV